MKPLKKGATYADLREVPDHFVAEMFDGELYASPEPTPADIAEIVAILERSGSRSYTRDQARRYRDEALAELASIGVLEPAAREHLEGIIVSVINA